MALRRSNMFDIRMRHGGSGRQAGKGPTRPIRSASDSHVSLRQGANYTAVLVITYDSDPHPWLQRSTFLNMSDSIIAEYEDSAQV